MSQEDVFERGLRQREVEDFKALVDEQAVDAGGVFGCRGRAAQQAISASLHAPTGDGQV